MRRLLELRLLALGALLATAALLVPPEVSFSQGPRAARPAVKLHVVPERNPVDLKAKCVPLDFGVNPPKDLDWEAKLSDLAYGGPTVDGGKVFVGTNNNFPRDPKVKGDRGILMCFDARTGKFLWQAVHDKLSGGGAGAMNPRDFAGQGI